MAITFRFIQNLHQIRPRTKREERVEREEESSIQKNQNDIFLQTESSIQKYNTGIPIPPSQGGY
jgi:hypothetical protein